MNDKEYQEYSTLIQQIGNIHDGTVEDTWIICEKVYRASKFHGAKWAEDIAERTNREPSTVYEMRNAHEMMLRLCFIFGEDEMKDAMQRGYSFFKIGWKWYQRGVEEHEIMDAIMTFSSYRKMDIELNNAHGDGFSDMGRVSFFSDKVRKLYEESEMLNLTPRARKLAKLLLRELEKVLP